MKRWRLIWNSRGGWAVALLAIGAWMLAGCATTDDPENLSERPWNTPKAWEGGLPAGMMEGR
jgi:hypothetical protein